MRSEFYSSRFQSAILKLVDHIKYGIKPNGIDLKYICE